MSTYLQLPPEFGGTRFGPYQGVVYIGSDPNRCQIVLDAKLGVFAIHCVVSETGPSAYTVSLAQQGLKLFLIQKGERKPWPIESAVQAKPGDQIVLASETGPRFIIEYAADQVKASTLVAGQSLSKPDLGSGVANEMARRAQAHLIAKNPYFRTFYQLRTRFKPGFWKSPYFIVSALSTVAAALFGGIVTCSGLLFGLFNNF